MKETAHYFGMKQTELPYHHPKKLAFVDRSFGPTIPQNLRVPVFQNPFTDFDQSFGQEKEHLSASS